MRNHILEIFGQRVREQRQKLGLSQEKLAEKAGMHRTYIGMVERAEKNIALTNIEKIAKALNVEIGTLLDAFSHPNQSSKIQYQIHLTFHACQLHQVRLRHAH
ncbi:MAG: transcriptional regulator [Acidobacteria bacterium]|nr:MAG: transcriptional regulator [Acidobacteriota bacterium]